MDTKEKIERARRVVFGEYAKVRVDEVLINVLTDLMHLAERSEVDFEKVITVAYGQYVAATGKTLEELPPLLGRLEKEKR